jgi:hypothetical protein
MLRSSLVVLAVSLLATGCTVRTGGRAYSPASSPVAAPAQATYPASAPAPAPAAAPAEEPGWEALGGRQVAFHAERDAIAVNPGPTYRSIRLHVSGNDLEMYDVRVTFGNGEVWSPNTRLHFGQGTSSRQIDPAARATSSASSSAIAPAVARRGTRSCRSSGTPDQRGVASSSLIACSASARSGASGGASVSAAR